MCRRLDGCGSRAGAADRRESPRSAVSAVDCRHNQCGGRQYYIGSAFISSHSAAPDMRQAAAISHGRCCRSPTCSIAHCRLLLQTPRPQNREPVVLSTACLQKDLQAHGNASLLRNSAAHAAHLSADASGRGHWHGVTCEQPWRASIHLPSPACRQWWRSSRCTSSRRPAEGHVHPSVRVAAREPGVPTIRCCNVIGPRRGQAVCSMRCKLQRAAAEIIRRDRTRTTSTSAWSSTMTGVTSSAGGHLRSNSSLKSNGRVGLAERKRRDALWQGGRVCGRLARRHAPAVHAPRRPR